MSFIERKIEEVEWNENNVGLEIEGLLIGVEKVKYSDGVGFVYTVKSANIPGKIFRFRGVKQLNSMVHESDVGKKVRVRYDGEDKSKAVTNGMHYPKKFTVAVEEEDSADTTITDSDIPF